jgi:hypothetical protein
MKSEHVNQFFITVILASIFFYFPIKYVYKNGYKKRCLKCRRWFALEEKNKKLLSKHKTTKIESNWVESGEFEIIEKRNKTVIRPKKKLDLRSVPATSYDYLHTFECKHCHHQTETKSNVII